MNFLKDIPIINQLFGENIGSLIVAILVIAFVYNSILKSGIIQPVFYVINYKSWKVKKEIERIKELLDNTELTETMKKNLKFRAKILHLQLSLKTKEIDLEILEYLSGFQDLPSAIKKYERSKSKLIYVTHSQSFSLTPDYSFNTNYKTAKRRNFWIPILYWVLTLPAAFSVIYLHNVKYLDSPSVSFFFSAPISLIFFSIWVLVIAFYLRHLLEKANAVELLHMERIQR